jgi:hypothetical protein
LLVARNGAEPLLVAVEIDADVGALGLKGGPFLCRKYSLERYAARVGPVPERRPMQANVAARKDRFVDVKGVQS